MLSALIWIPIAGAIAIFLLPLTGAKAKSAAIAVATVPLLWSIYLFTQFDLGNAGFQFRSEEHTSELQSLTNLVCRLLLEKKKKRHTLLHTNTITYAPHIPPTLRCFS